MRGSHVAHIYKDTPRNYYAGLLREYRVWVNIEVYLIL